MKMEQRKKVNLLPFCVIIVHNSIYFFIVFANFKTLQRNYLSSKSSLAACKAHILKYILFTMLHWVKQVISFILICSSCVAVFFLIYAPLCLYSSISLHRRCSLMCHFCCFLTCLSVSASTMSPHPSFHAHICLPGSVFERQ